MNTKLGMRNYGNDEEHQFMGREVHKTFGYSERTAEMIDDEVTGLLKWSYDEAMRILNEKRSELDTMCDVLLAEETISGQDVHEIVKYNRILSDEERAELEPESVPPSDSGEPEAEPPVATEESKAENVIDDGDAPFPDPSPA